VHGEPRIVGFNGEVVFRQRAPRTRRELVNVDLEETGERTWWARKVTLHPGRQMALSRAPNIDA
jgi:hypothetical protein